MSRLKPFFLSLLIWLFEGNPLQRRTIIHNSWLIRTLLTIAWIGSFVGAGLIFWFMSMPYFTMAVLVAWFVLVILWAVWKIEIREDTRDEVTEIDKTMIGL